MAATVGILNGTDLLVCMGANALLHSTDCSIQLSQSTRDSSTKASSGWKSILPGQRSFSLSANGLVALDASYNLAYLLDLIINRTRVLLNFKTANADDYYLQGYAYLNSIQATAPNNNNVTYTASFEGDGALSRVTLGGGDIREPNGIAALSDEAVIDGTNDLYIGDSATAIAIVLDHITNVRGKIPIKNEGVGDLTITAEDGLLLDGNASIYITTGQEIIIFPNETKFEVIGTYQTIQQ